MPEPEDGGVLPRPTARGRGRTAAPRPGHATDARNDTHGHGAGHDPLRGPEGSPWVRYERLREELGGDGLNRPSLPDLSALLALLEGLRALVPREVSDQFTALLRELLLTLRALIDWYLERLEPDEREPQVEEIPIE
jgi:hypothetical protein